jgi:hypothetical protein
LLLKRGGGEGRGQTGVDEHLGAEVDQAELDGDAARGQRRAQPAGLSRPFRWSTTSHRLPRMRAVQITRFRGREGLDVVERPDPAPGEE